MRAFNQIVVFLFALIVCVFAAEDAAYDTTVYVTSTVYRVNTVTLSGSHTADAQNQTSTISATYPTYPATNATTKAPTGTAVQPPAATFTGAASSLSVNALVAALVAGAGLLAL